MAKSQNSEKSKAFKNRFQNDPDFARMRENVKEFNNSMGAAKLIRNAFRGLIMATAVNGTILNARMQRLFVQIVQSDPTSDRGERLVSKGDLSMAKKFDFNDKAFLEVVLFALYTSTADRVSGRLAVQFPEFIPATSLTAPKGTSHFRIVTAAAEFDFEKGEYLFKEAKSAIIPYNNVMLEPLNLEVSITPDSKLAFLHVLGVECYQEVNGKMYALKDASHTALSVIHAESAVV